jgi:hypothetical protein
MKKLFATIIMALLHFYIFAAEYQWSVPIDGKDPQARAFLWVPSTCKYIRAVLFANQVILEKKVFDHPQLRQICQQEDLAMVIVFRSPFTYFKYKEGADTVLQNILQSLATVSGYDELTSAPLLPIAHSGAAIGAWNMAYWKPERIAGIITLHAATMVNPPEKDPKATISGIPVMAVSGEYESWADSLEPIDKHWRWLRGDLLDLRAKYKNAQVFEVVQPGAGHFNFDEHLAKLCVLFVKKIADYRLYPKDSHSTGLINIEEADGWLSDNDWRSKIRPHTYRKYKHDSSLAFWYLDEELAKAVKDFPALYGGNKDQRVSFVQHNKTILPSWISDLAFEPLEDGMQIAFKGDFLKQTPFGVAGAGKALSNNHQPIHFSLIGGWGGGGKQINDSVFQIQFDHFGWSKTTAQIMVMAYADGDKRYKYAEQAGQVKFPELNKKGQQQQIVFDAILPKGGDKIILQAKTNAGLPVSYFIQSGPAELIGSELHLTAIPPRAKFPISITVIAYQWGRTREPLIQSAAPVQRTFLIDAAHKINSF